MTASELEAQYRQQLKDRLSELVAEQAQIEKALGNGEERRTEERPARKKVVWTEARRKAQSRRLKAFHRNNQ